MFPAAHNESVCVKSCVITPAVDTDLEMERTAQVYLLIKKTAPPSSSSSLGAVLYTITPAAAPDLTNKTPRATWGVFWGRSAESGGGGAQGDSGSCSSGEAGGGAAADHRATYRNVYCSLSDMRRDPDRRGGEDEHGPAKSFLFPDYENQGPGLQLSGTG